MLLGYINMATLSHRRSTLLLLLIAAALIRGSHGQDGSSKSSRREASDSQESTFVGFDNRADAFKSICHKTEQRMFNDFIDDVEAGTGVFNPEVPPLLFKKPIISKSYRIIWLRV